MSLFRRRRGEPDYSDMSTLAPPAAEPRPRREARPRPQLEDEAFAVRDQRGRRCEVLGSTTNTIRGVRS